MLLTLTLLLYPGPIDPATRYDGRAGKLAVQVPRLEAEPVIDGKLDEPVWGEAALQAAGLYARSDAFGRRSFRGDFLFSYQPTPGTVFFAGYGSTLRDPTPLGRANLKRSEDGFFLKLSYLFQL